MQDFEAVYRDYFADVYRYALALCRDREAARQLYGLLDRLPETSRTVFCLRVFGALPFAGIGASMGKTESWARVVYFRARQTLREAYDEL